MSVRTEHGIVDHLRRGLGNVEFGSPRPELDGLNSIMREAADEIERLRKTLISTRAVLKRMSFQDDFIAIEGIDAALKEPET